MKLINTKDYLLLIDEEAEINSGDYWIYINPNTTFDEIIEKTPLNEKNWFSKLHDRFAYKKVIAFCPLKLGLEVLDLPLLPPCSLSNIPTGFIPSENCRVKSNIIGSTIHGTYTYE